MSKPKASEQKPPPAPPSPQGEYYYENGQLRSQRTYDQGKNAYITNSYSSPESQAIENKANSYMGSLVDRIPQAVNLSPEAIQGYKDAFMQPQLRGLNESYNKARGQAEMSAAGTGMRNSIGFNRYLSNELERNRAQGVADIEANAKLMEYDLPNKLLSPFVNQFNLYNAAASGQQAQMAQDLEPAFQGSQAGQNALNQNYQNQLQYWQAQQKPQPQRGGLFSFFSGGS